MYRSHIKWAEVWEQWAVIFTDLRDDHCEIRRFDTKAEAVAFQESLELNEVLPWYLK